MISDPKYADPPIPSGTIIFNRNRMSFEVYWDDKLTALCVLTPDHQLAIHFFVDRLGMAPDTIEKRLKDAPQYPRDFLATGKFGAWSVLRKWFPVDLEGPGWKPRYHWTPPADLSRMWGAR